jgi:YHS domain-containing protein
MIRWSVLMILSIASACCLAATIADDKDKTAEKTPSRSEKAESEEAIAEAGKDKKDSEDKFTAKCPVSGETAVKEQFAAYKEKEVYFCCDKCKAAFEAEPAKFEVKANHQLVQTKQFKQKKCPISGGDVVKEQSTRVANVNIRFCCEKCKGAVESAAADKRLEMIFAEAAFKKAFVAVKAKDGDAKDKPKGNKGKKTSEKKVEKAEDK